ncbi:hypothetical protein ACHHYP_07444 [Achlya hypogyna]|uniref:Uncharacterized protein n=1 Tax=Achlya hypogyna TaxID=1202772 RepID=A0A1V9ZLU1_ACHHY|nr:hypothetical protein ACHHYP_07444 [Achlya hypogyna]
MAPVPVPATSPQFQRVSLTSPVTIHSPLLAPISRQPSESSAHSASGPGSRRGSFIRMASKRIQSIHSRRLSYGDDLPPMTRSRRSSHAPTIGAASPSSSNGSFLADGAGSINEATPNGWDLS